MSFLWNDKKRMAEQLKFFGAKKQGFISCYAKKPRILVKVKPDKLNAINTGYNAIRMAYDDLHRRQRALGMQNSTSAYMQIAAANQSAQLQVAVASRQYLCGYNQSLLGHLFGCVS